MTAASETPAASISREIAQGHFAELVDISSARVSQLLSEGVLPSSGTGLQWLHAYCHRLREQAAGRHTDGPLNLAQERAALAREQRAGIEIKNGVLRGEYAAISLLSETLGSASQAVAERFDHLPGRIKNAVPDLTAAVLDQVLAVIAEARNEWVIQTVALVSAIVDDDADTPAESNEQP